MAELAIIDDKPIRVTADGRWLHGDEPLHPRVEALFKRSVVPTIEGDYFVVLGRERQQLTVADTPFAVATLTFEEKKGELQTIRLLISDGVAEELDPTTLMAASDNTFYCRIVRHGLSVPCRIPPRHYYPIALRMEEDGDSAVLAIAGQRFTVGTYRPKPTH